MNAALLLQFQGNPIGVPLSAHELLLLQDSLLANIRFNSANGGIGDCSQYAQELAGVYQKLRGPQEALEEAMSLTRKHL